MIGAFDLHHAPNASVTSTSLRHALVSSALLAFVCTAVQAATRPRSPLRSPHRRSRRSPACRRCPIRRTSTASRPPGKLLPSLANDLPRVYVPHIQSNDVYVIDPATLKIVDKYKVGLNPHHIVPSWDLKTLWVANTAENTKKGSVMPIDPKTGKVGKAIPVEDPYNMYFSPDGKFAIVVAEAYKRLDFRDPQTMALQFSMELPQCEGINHADFSIDGRYAIFTCEFDKSLVKIDMVERKTSAT